MLLLAFMSSPVNAQIPSFTAPDTVCVNGPVNINNTSVGGTSYYWSFCDADLRQIPQATNLGNIGGVFSQPVFMDIVSQAGNYYAFVTNHVPGNLIRLDFGNSLLNMPTATALGNFGGIINAGYGTEGVQVIQNNGNWYALIVGGDPISGGVPKIVQVNFGPDITNPAPVATDWGNLGNMKQSIGFYVFNDGGNWYGFAVNSTNNSFTRFDFGNNLDVPPSAVNLGNPGNYFDYPTSICPLKDPATGQWHVFITNGNGYSPDALERLDFGTSLLNNSPTPVLLGNPGGAIAFARDIKIILECNQIIGFIPNGTNNDILRLDFNNNILSVPTVTSLGNFGNFDFCHSLSKLFRVGPDLYTLVPNVDNNTITRVRFAGCTNASIPNSSAVNPPTVSYSQPGSYQINMIMDDGLSTQSSFCKTVTVGMIKPFSLGNDTAICQPGMAILSYADTSDPAPKYLWQDGTTSDADTARVSGKYKLMIEDAYGCTIADSVNVTYRSVATVQTRPDTAICAGGSLPLTTLIGNADSVLWTPAGSLSDPRVNSPVATPTGGTTYIVTAYHESCTVSDTITVDMLANPKVTITPDTLVCADSALQLQAGGGTAYRWSPGRGLSDSTLANPVVTSDSSSFYFVKVTAANTCTNIDSVLITSKKPARFAISPGKSVCAGDPVGLAVREVNGSRGDSVLWLSNTGSQNSTGDSAVFFPTQTSTYEAVGYDHICRIRDTLNAEIVVQSGPVVTVTKSNDIGCVLGTATLTATGGNYYSWTPASTLSDPTVYDPVASPDSSTVYFVRVADGSGCSTLDSIQLNVVKAGKPNGFPVPSAFTPNGDGHNDCFGIRYWGAIGEFELSVYDRWGVQVFHTRNPGECWDGTFAGKPQPVGTYVYMIKVFALCGDAFRKGTVELIR
jgi:gliding motility-associated-like protein